MQELSNKYADDPDAQTLYAEALLLPVRWHWYSIDGKPAEGVPKRSGFLKVCCTAIRIIRGQIISTSTPWSRRRRPNARFQARNGSWESCRAAGHIVHMPGHIWLVLGDYNNTVAVNERAVEVDRQYFSQTGMMGSYFAYYLHNQQFILYARAMQGRLADARKAAREIPSRWRHGQDHA